MPQEKMRFKLYIIEISHNLCGQIFMLWKGFFRFHERKGYYSLENIGNLVLILEQRHLYLWLYLSKIPAYNSHNSHFKSRLNSHYLLNKTGKIIPINTYNWQAVGIYGGIKVEIICGNSR